LIEKGMSIQTDATTMTSPAEEVAQNAEAGPPGGTSVFELLNNGRRRRVIRYFDEFDGPVSIGDLTDQVAAWEFDAPPGGVTTDERQRVYIALYQSHLDTLASHGIVEYDADAGTVAAGERHETVARHLVTTADATAGDTVATATDRHKGAWPSYYLGISLGGLLLGLGHLLQVVPAELLSLEVLNVVVVAAYALVATVQFLHSRNP
jgi:hypothetical protein